MADEDHGTAPPPIGFEEAAVPFPVVGIGASAGGVQALQAFFEHMPTGSGMAFVVVVHLSPKHESHLDKLLQGVTTMPVVQVREAMPIRPDHIYVISPNQSLQMSDGRLVVGTPERNRGRHGAIDLFFRTLAQAHQAHAVGIVLSGTGSDGTLGLKSVKEQGGIAIAQLPQDAQYDAMPRNAIGTGAVDFVLPVSEMPKRVMQVWQNAKRIRLPPLEEPTAADRQRAADDALRDVLLLLRERTGHDFQQYKRGTLLRRIERRLQVNQLRDLPTYRAFLRDHEEETPLLMRDLLISVTQFFRDREAFDALARKVVPRLFDGKGADDSIRVWVPGCATGEEAYSIAMLLLEHAQALAAPPAIQIFATDIDPDALATARAGLYPEGISVDVGPARLRRFFTKDAGGYRIHEAVRERILFSPQNFIKDPPFSRLDLLSCRNLLIYLTREAQARVFDIVHFALGAGGYLFLGTSEHVDDEHGGFLPVDKAHRIFRSIPDARAGRDLPGFSYARAAHPLPIVDADLPRKGALAQLHQSLLEHYAPPSVVVNDQCEILHLSASANRFLEFSAGEPSLNIVKAVVPELRLELRAALRQAMQSSRTVSARATMTRGDTPSILHMTVHPVRERGTDCTFALVLFEEHAAVTAEGERSIAPHSVVQELDAELKSTKHQLRTTIDEYETQNEELKAGNEELQAVNEELRSASEELETSKEELQSINEELTTVNQELKNKVDETSRINNDLQNLIASTEIAVLFLDRSLRLMRFTPQARQVFNVIGSDIGRSVTDITHRLDYSTLQEDVESVMESLRILEREVRSENGRWYLVRLLPYRTLEDRIVGTVITFTDVTTRKEADEKLRLGEEWMRLVVEGVREYAIVTIDPSGLVMTWNEGAQRVFGYSTDQIVGRPAAILFTAEDQAAGLPDLEMKRASAHGRAEDERWHVRQDGTLVYCSGIMAPLRDGRKYGFVKIARDMTQRQLIGEERERAFEQERHARETIEDANRQKDQFLATLSHELRNPLNLILMQAQLLLRTDAFRDPKARHTAEIIFQTAATQARLVDDLLDMSRVMTGKLAIQQQLVPLPFIVGDSIGGLSHDAEQKGVTVDLDLTPEPLIVQADPVRVRQIAWNLLSNALKFTPTGGRITVRLARAGNEARLDVIDTGQGIEPDMQPHIFELFRQSEQLARPHGGMGIGLALVQQLVELHGGRIEVFSEGRDKGSRFTVWLPLYTAPAPDVRAVATPIALGSQSSTHAHRTSPLAGTRILVIDDGEDAVDALRELLQMEGADVRAAVSGHQALDLARQQPFDVIVSDLAMPGMDGFTLLRNIRAAGKNTATPAIALSGFNRPKDIERTVSEGFAAHLSKPVGVRELVDAIVHVVERAR